MKKKDKPTYKSDYSKEMLPKSRTVQFGRILRDNFVIFVKLGLILMFLMLPFVFALTMKNIGISNVMKDAALSDAEKLEKSVFLSIVFGAIYIPCIMFLFVGLCGILKILRRLIWDEPLFFKHDFFVGIKESFGPFLLYGFLSGLIGFFNILAFHIAVGYVKYISYGLIGISFAIVMPILLVAAYVSSIYSCKLSTSFTVSVKLFARRGIFTILILLILYTSYFLNFLQIPIVFYVAIIFVLIILPFPIWLLLSYINCFKNLDDYINVYHYPDKAYLGLSTNRNQNKQKNKDQNNNQVE